MGCVYVLRIRKSRSVTNLCFLQLFDVLKASPLARLGYHQYAHITSIFDMEMPMMPDDYASAGVLGGSASQVDADQNANGEKSEQKQCLPKGKIVDHLP